MTETLTSAAAATRAGVSPSTWRSWRSRRPGYVPEPDGWHDRRTPYWRAATIDAWRAEHQPQRKGKPS
jgi:hypothetical protein